MTLAPRQQLSIHRESKSSVNAKKAERPGATHGICFLEVEYPAQWQEIRLQAPNSHLNRSQIKFADLYDGIKFTSDSSQAVTYVSKISV